MLKNNKGYIVMFVLLSQTILSITLGMLSLHFSSKGHILPNVYINSIDVGNLTKSEAVSIVKEHYDKLSENSSLVIRYDDREFKIKLSDIDFSTSSIISLFIGPEGGYSSSEISLAESSGAVSFSCGSRVFRAETAAAVIPSIILSYC